MISEFQQDLRNGMGLSEALNKHGLTFKEAVLYSPRPFTKQKKPASTHEKYIHAPRCGHYTVRKYIRNRIRTFGTYYTLEDAIRIRNHCIKYGWKERSIDEYCKELGIKRCVHRNKRRNKRYK